MGSTATTQKASAGMVNRRWRAFTMVELLTVIAIIAILAAITFPVYARVKDSAFKSSDISNMNAIRVALQQYRADQGGYPPALLGYITPYQFQTGTAEVVPANLVVGALYPKRIESLDTLRPNYARVAKDLLVAGIWPAGDNRGVGTAPILDLNGDGAITPADDTAQARQAFSSDTSDASSVSYFAYDLTGAGEYAESSSPAANDAGRFWAISGYDVAPVRLGDGTNAYEVHYTRFWSGYGVTTGNVEDDPRQLGYSEPPESTVITWNTYFRNYSGTNTLASGQSKDIVLFLGGSAKPVDSRLMSERAWRLEP